MQQERLVMATALSGLQISFKAEFLRRASGVNRIGPRSEAANEEAASQAALDAALESATKREFHMELRSMVGGWVMGGMGDSESGTSLFMINGVLTEVRSREGELQLVIDESRENGPLIPLASYSGGTVEPGSVHIRMGRIYLDLVITPAPDAAE